MTNEELHQVTADLRVVHKLKAVCVMVLGDDGKSLFSLALPSDENDQGMILTNLPKALREAAIKIENATKEEAKRRETSLS